MPRLSSSLSHGQALIVYVCYRKQQPVIFFLSSRFQMTREILPVILKIVDSRQPVPQYVYIYTHSNTEFFVAIGTSLGYCVRNDVPLLVNDIAGYLAKCVLFRQSISRFCLYFISIKEGFFLVFQPLTAHYVA